MENKEVAEILYEIADLLEMEDVEWKPRAYRRAARSVEALSEPIEEIDELGELQQIDGVGESIAEKISEYIETGELEYYEELKQRLPVDIEALTAVEGLGPKTARKLYSELDVKTLDDLEKAAEEGEIEKLEGFGEKTEQNILGHIEAAREGQERILLGKALPIARNIREKLEGSKNFNKVEIVGSFRRRRPTVGDIDILATSPNYKEAMKEFTDMGDVKEVLNHGDTKSSVLIFGGLQMDIRIVEYESWGAALQYFTGSKDHNIALRNRAIAKGWKLNEYGLFEEEENLVKNAGEKEIYRKLKLDYIAPELREHTGEVEASEKGELPELVDLEDIRGDLQVHTNYSDGNSSIESMADKAQEKGYEYIMITDHGPKLHVAGGPESREELEQQREEIQSVNEEYDIEVLQSIEANITREGIDVNEEMLELLDFIVVAMHDRIENPTDRIIEVLDSHPVDILAHPLNRKINSREPLDLDLERLVEKAAEEKVALEINSQPDRLDLPWDLVKQHRDKLKFVVSTDAHATGELDFIDIGVAQARRGWLEKKDVLNARNLEELKNHFSG
ncbi:MAG: DNA polymerase/3'-5' exonuclease PolX [Candidatus Nanohaloarchaea archaeon]